jgi:hypothetical protein
MLATVLLGFLNVCLYCAVIILVAFIFVWAWETFIGPINGNVFKWGKIVVGLLCIIVLVSWLLSVIGGGPVVAPHFLGRW